MSVGRVLAYVALVLGVVIVAAVIYGLLVFFSV